MESIMRSNTDAAQLRSQYRDDGAVFIPGALDESCLTLAERCFNWTLENPGPGAGSVLAGTPGTFYQDQANPDSFPAYREFLCETNVADIAATLFDCENIWLMYEQIWLKDGADTRRTPWHQDLPYLPASGEHLAVMWTCLDRVAKEDSLEFIQGSHCGPLYNPSAFNPEDVAANLFDGEQWPQLPDVDAARGDFPILSWAMEPGDVVVFHPAMLHGGAQTRSGIRRRTLSLRFFGDDAWVAARPHDGMANVDGLKHDDGGRHPLKKMALAEPGSRFRHPDFPQLRPR
ncbi:MAG: ectoine hydroxylase-related dioxygenase (phytanoyl-CoA dioxygenase family) [Gammaproteobacteria bacterium]|jgi:ectoine hydroxylase-related dioxygenase (phytanoyl-CoA dioxygenase family)